MATFRNQMILVGILSGVAAALVGMWAAETRAGAVLVAALLVPVLTVGTGLVLMGRDD